MRRATKAATAAVAAAVSAVAVTVVARDDTPDPTARRGPQAVAVPTADPSVVGEVAAAYNQLAPDLPRDVIARRVALTGPRKALLKEFGTEPSFAGSWYDYGTGVWHLLGTDQARLDAWVARASAPGIATAPRLVAHSFHELDARSARIRAGDDPLSRFSRQAGLDVLGNRVHVVVGERPDVEDDMVVWVDYVGVPYPEVRPG